MKFIVDVNLVPSDFLEGGDVLVFLESYSSGIGREDA